jgi:hypothetical protein
MLILWIDGDEEIPPSLTTYTSFRRSEKLRRAEQEIRRKAVQYR